jgi:hypothetical protein
MQIDMCTCIHVLWLCVCTHKHTNIILAASTWGPSALEPCQCLQVVLATSPSILKKTSQHLLVVFGIPISILHIWTYGHLHTFTILMLFITIIYYYYRYHYCYWFFISIIINDYQQAPPNVTVQHRQGHRVGDVFIFDLRQKHSHSHARTYTRTCTRQTNK